MLSTVMLEFRPSVDMTYKLREREYARFVPALASYRGVTISMTSSIRIRPISWCVAVRDTVRHAVSSADNCPRFVSQRPQHPRAPSHNCPGCAAVPVARELPPQLNEPRIELREPACNVHARAQV